MNETLGIIIAVIALVAVIYAGVRLYTTTTNQDMTNAEVMLDTVVGKANTLEDGESNVFIIRRLKGWRFVGWSVDEEPRPDRCLFDSCICVCPDGESCQKAGFCEDVSFRHLGVFGYPGSSETFLSEFRGSATSADDILRGTPEEMFTYYKDRAISRSEPGPLGAAMQECSEPPPTSYFESGDPDESILQEVGIYRGDDVLIVVFFHTGTYAEELYSLDCKEFEREST